ncbi:hypothetical protein ACO22_06086 [Paracoccidioides brasiliensis]|uniref:RAD52 homolog n=1 Tax=Paracoccidioides brasiliensis TaxID=121759 RepID=A0A1D2J8H8_PARBR|nr:hypothetical protein ACO22_06086 [Paracoccidioides brasiliensis]
MYPSTAGNITTNPFEVPEHRLNQYTAQQISTLQIRLDKRLGPEYISSRQGPGGQKVHYLAAEKCINLANEVFGFNGWSSSIQNIQIDFVDENPNTAKISLGLSVIVRVTLKDGTFHEDIGYGHCENSKSKALAFEKAKKEGTTDGLKRALRTFGNVLGNCVYDKEYLSRITKVKAVPSKWDVGDLHRHADHTVVKKETNPTNPTTTGASDESLTVDSELPPRLPDPPSVKVDETLPLELEGEFGSDLFDEADFGESHSVHPDEVSTDPEQAEQFQRNPQQIPAISHESRKNLSENITRPSNQTVTPSKQDRSWAAGSASAAQPDLPPIPGERLNRPSLPQTSTNHYPQSNSKTPSGLGLQSFPRKDAIPIPSQQPNRTPNLPPSLPSDQLKEESDGGPKDNGNVSSTKASSPSPFASQIPEDKRPQDPAGGFYSARAADELRDNPYAAIKSAPAFDPHFDSPSIRKTAGINHNTSAPVLRAVVGINSPQFTDAGGKTVPSASQAQTSHGANNNGHDLTKRGPTPGPIGGNGNRFVPPTVRGPMTTSSYQPPIRKVMTRSAAAGLSPAANPSMNPSQAQNVNGKRPPFTDLTNVRGSEGCNDLMKKSKVGDGNNVSNSTTA